MENKNLKGKTKEVYACLNVCLLCEILLGIHESFCGNSPGKEEAEVHTLRLF